MRGGIVVITTLLAFLPPAAALEYTDSSGRLVALERPPERVIAVGPGAMRLLAYLGAGDMVIATESIEIKFPKGRPYSVVLHDKLKTLPVIGEGGPHKAPDYERLVALAPDLIIACSLEPQLAAALESKTRVPVFNADYGNLGTFETERFKKTLSTLGALLGRGERAGRLNAAVDAYVKDLGKRSSRAGSAPSVYVGGLGFKGAHGITSTQYGYEPFRLLGLRNAPDAPGAAPLHVFIDKEKLLKLDPDYIFLDSGGLSIIAGDYAASPKYYRLLKAFRTGRVYTTLPYNSYTTNVESMFANAYFIGKTVYPEKFSDVNLRAKAGEIFRAFVGRDVYDGLMDNDDFYKKLGPGDGLVFEAPR